MAEEVDIGGDGALFVGEDKTLRLEVLDTDGVPVDIAGWTIVLLIRERNTSTVALLTKTASISGTYSATRASNTQRAIVTLTDTETAAMPVRPNQHSWKRTDDGSETVLAYGTFTLERATQI